MALALLRKPLALCRCVVGHDHPGVPRMRAGHGGAPRSRASTHRVPPRQGGAGCRRTRRVRVLRRAPAGRWRRRLLRRQRLDRPGARAPPRPDRRRTGPGTRRAHPRLCDLGLVDRGVVVAPGRHPLEAAEVERLSQHVLQRPGGRARRPRPPADRERRGAGVGRSHLRLGSVRAAERRRALPGPDHPRRPPRSHDVDVQPRDHDRGRGAPPPDHRRGGVPGTRRRHRTGLSRASTCHSWSATTPPSMRSSFGTSCCSMGSRQTRLGCGSPAVTASTCGRKAGIRERASFAGTALRSTTRPPWRSSTPCSPGPRHIPSRQERRVQGAGRGPKI